jgi:selenocysteine lyase/cysteine desulfurase
MGLPTLYFDHSATSWPKSDRVKQAMLAAMDWGNPGRGGHRLALDAGRCVFEARLTLAELLGCADETRCVFTSGATEGLNMAIHGLMPQRGRVLSTGLEHNAVARPLERGRLEDGWEWLTLGVTGDEVLVQLEEQLKAKSTDLVVINHVSNVSGERQNLPKCLELCRHFGVPLLLDASQSFGYEPLKSAAGLVIAAGAHKGLGGPMGVGFLAIGEGVSWAPQTLGGTGSRSEALRQPEFLPDRYESGTPNVPGLAGLLAACEGVSDQTLNERQKMIQEHRKRLMVGLKDLDVEVIGPDEGGAALSFRSRIDDGLLAQALWEDHAIALRSGLHCSPLAHRSLKTFPHGTLRLSPSYLTKEEEVDQVLKILEEKVI